jgi:hypothetical protein
MQSGGQTFDEGSAIAADLLSFLNTVQVALSYLSIPHCVIGAVALGAWGRMRATHDLDFLVLIDGPSREELIARLSSSGITANQQWAAANPMAKSRVTRFAAREHPLYPLDIIYASDQHEREVVNRAQTTTLLGVSFPVVSAEDLMLLKLKAGRPTDFDDVISIIRNPRLQLDLNYLWSWADRLGLQGELHYVLQAAAGKPEGDAPSP